MRVIQFLHRKKIKITKKKYMLIDTYMIFDTTDERPKCDGNCKINHSKNKKNSYYHPSIIIKKSYINFE